MTLIETGYATVVPKRTSQARGGGGPAAPYRASTERCGQSLNGCRSDEHIDFNISLLSFANNNKNVSACGVVCGGAHTVQGCDLMRPSLALGVMDRRTICVQINQETSAIIQQPAKQPHNCLPMYCLTYVSGRVSLKMYLSCHQSINHNIHSEHLTLTISHKIQNEVMRTQRKCALKLDLGWGWKNSNLIELERTRTP